MKYAILRKNGVIIYAGRLPEKALSLLPEKLSGDIYSFYSILLDDKKAIIEYRADIRCNLCPLKQNEILLTKGSDGKYIPNLEKVLGLIPNQDLDTLLLMSGLKEETKEIKSRAEV